MNPHTLSKLEWNQRPYQILYLDSYFVLFIYFFDVDIGFHALKLKGSNYLQRKRSLD